MSGPDRSPGDPFEGLTLDEDWVAEATRQELPAHARVARAAVESSAREAREEQQAAAWRLSRTRRRKRRALVLGALLLFSTAVAVADRNGQGGQGDPTWDAGALSQSYLTLGGTPTPAPATSDEPLGTAQDPDAAGGDFAFLATQADGTTPVAYDPCRTIEVVVNPEGAPAGASKIVERAIAQAARISGLSLTITGPSTEQPAMGRAARQQKRYGDRWAPILVAWSDEARFPVLADDVAGVGGSIAVATDDGPSVYVSGMIVLDGPDAQQILDDDPDGEQVVEDIVQHELAHVLGLAHVDSDAELMYPEGQPDLHGYQPGDRAGLTKVGQGPCVREL